MTSLHVCVVGAGAMGTLYGTALVRAGNDVVFLDSWEPLVYELRQDPFARLKTDGGTEKVPVNIFTQQEAPEKTYDLVIFFVKSTNTADAIQSIVSQGIVKDTTVVITCQGGFANPEIIAEKLPDPSMLLTGCTKSHCKSCGPMSIEKFNIGPTTLWPFSNTEPSDLVKNVINECNKAGLNIEITPKALTDRWKMLLAYPANAAVSAVSGLTYGDVYDTEEGKALLYSIAREVVLVAQLEGIDASLFNEEIAKATIDEIANEYPDNPGTILLDMRAHRMTEIDATSGALIKKAASNNIELPCIKSIWSLIKIKEKNYGMEY